VNRKGIAVPPAETIVPTTSPLSSSAEGVIDVNPLGRGIAVIVPETPLAEVGFQRNA
jgi:hypothetical protein